METETKAATEYLMAIESLLKAHTKHKSNRQHENFIQSVRQNVEECICDHPEYTLYDLESRLGSPEEIIADYLRDNHIDTPGKFVREKHRKTVWIIVILILLLVVLTFIGVYLYDSYEISQGYGEQIVIIEEEV